MHESARARSGDHDVAMELRHAQCAVIIMDDGRNYIEFESPMRADIFHARVPLEVREVKDGMGYCSRCRCPRAGLSSSTAGACADVARRSDDSD
jgi:hypothetical protein